MSTMRYINSYFWNDPYVSDGLDPTEKLLYMYFLTNESTNLAGVYEISIRKMAFETGIDKEMIGRIIDRFQKDRKIYFYDNYVVISNFIKNQSLNDNMMKNIVTILDSLPAKIKSFISDKLNIPKSTRYERLSKALKSFSNPTKPLPKDLKPLPNPSEGLPNRSEAFEILPETETEIEKEIEIKNKTEHNTLQDNNKTSNINNTCGLSTKQYITINTIIIII